jgi:hypothetical protein
VALDEQQGRVEEFGHFLSSGRRRGIAREDAGRQQSDSAEEETAVGVHGGDGANPAEQSALRTCGRFVEAQRLFLERDCDRDGVRNFAESLHVLAGAGLTEWGIELIHPSTVAREVLPGQPMPRDGYAYKVLKAQGPHAPGGQKSYLTKNADGVDQMTEGFALVAAYTGADRRGWATFIVSHHGKAYWHDYGADTAKAFETMTEFDPTPEWTEVRRK